MQNFVCSEIAGIFTESVVKGLRHCLDTDLFIGTVDTSFFTEQPFGYVSVVEGNRFFVKIILSMLKKYINA